MFASIPALITTLGGPIIKRVLSGAAGRWVSALANPRALAALAIAVYIASNMGHRDGYREAAAECQVQSAKAVSDLKGRMRAKENNLADVSEAAIREAETRLADLHRKLQAERNARTNAERTREHAQKTAAACIDYGPVLERLRKKSGH